MTDNVKLIFTSYEKFWDGIITLEEYHKILKEITMRIDKESEYKNELLWERFESGSNDEEE